MCSYVSTVNQLKYYLVIVIPVCFDFFLSVSSFRFFELQFWKKENMFAWFIRLNNEYVAQHQVIYCFFYGIFIHTNMLWKWTERMKM